jgi:protein TonB
MKTSNQIRFVRAIAIAAFAFSFTTGAVAGTSTMQVLERVQPEFPREADRAGVNDGKVKARMTIDASGEVTRVEVLEATPRRIFDREVVRALSQWRFAKGGDARAMEVDLEFRR